MSREFIEHGGMRLGIEPGIGAGIAEFSAELPRLGRVHLMRPAPPPKRVKWFNDLACYLLAPWSNRIANASFTWRGKKHLIHADWPDHSAIHGLVKDREFAIEQRAAASTVLSCRVPAGTAGFAWGFQCHVRYELGEGELRVGLEVRNEGGHTSAMPVGLGFHPFWLRALDGGSDEVRVRVGGLRRYPCERMIPTGPAAEDEVCRELAAGAGFGAMKLDDVFAGSSHGAEILWERSGVRAGYRCSGELGHTVIYSGMEGSFCLEPVTMVNDGFVMEARGCAGTGVESLARGKAFRAEWCVEVGILK